MASKGKGARDKGAAFERLIVNKLKEAFADQPWAASIRRGKQSHTADECDVTGVPRLWIECQHADHVTPLKKLEQAERDEDLAASRAGDPLRYPVAVTRQTGRRDISVHLRLEDLRWLCVPDSVNSIPYSGLLPRPMVTLSLADFIALYRAHGTAR